MSDQHGFLRNARRHHVTLTSHEAISGASPEGASSSRCAVVHASSFAKVTAVVTAQRRMSRAQTEHPLNWVLVLIGGIVFLLLFFSIIRAVAKNHERSVDTTTIAGLKMVVREAQASPGTVMNASVPEFTTRCDRGTLIAQLERQDTPFDGHILFTTPSTGGELILWSESFELPGPVATVTYLFPKKTLVLVEDVEPVKSLLSMLPPEITKRSFSSSNLASVHTKGFDTVIVVFNNNPLGIVQGDANVYGVKISVVVPQTALLPQGKIDYYSYSSSSWSSISPEKTYYGKALLMGALAAGMKEQYDCGYDALNARFKTFSDIQSKRSEMLYSTSGIPIACKTEYVAAKNAFSTLVNNGLSTTNIAQFRDRIFQANQALGRNNCALLY